MSDFIDVPTPDAARLPALSVTMAWWALATAAFFIVVAPLLGQAYNVPNVLTGIALSVLVFSALAAVLARFAINSGASVAVFSQEMFGTAGAVVSTLILFATTLYYAVFEGSVVAVAFSFLVPTFDLRIASLIVVIYSVAFVFGPIHKWLDRINGLLLPIYAIGLAALLLLAARRGAFLSPDWSSGNVTLSGVIAVFSAYMGLWILPMCTFDFARFGRRSDIDYHARFTFGLPYYFLTIVVNGLAGIALVSSLPKAGPISEASVVEDIVKLMGVGGFVFLWATQTRINTANYYLASINLAGLARFLTGREIGHFAAIVTVGVLAYILMLGNVMSYLFVALAYQGIFVVAWVAVAVGYALTHDPKAVTAKEKPAFKIGGLASWFLGVAAGVVVHLYGGEAMFLSPLVSAFVAGLAYILVFAAQKERRDSSVVGSTAPPPR